MCSVPRVQGHEDTATSRIVTSRAWLPMAGSMSAIHPWFCASAKCLRFVRRLFLLRVDLLRLPCDLPRGPEELLHRILHAGRCSESYTRGVAHGTKPARVRSFFRLISALEIH